MKRVIREIKCLTCSWEERRWIMMKEMQLFYWEGTRVASGSWAPSDSQLILKHKVLCCPKCQDFADELPESEVRARLKEFYAASSGRITKYEDKPTMEENLDVTLP